jgi:hypothetical protein
MRSEGSSLRPIASASGEMGSLARHALVVCYLLRTQTIRRQPTDAMYGWSLRRRGFDGLSALQPCLNVCGSDRSVLRSGTSPGCPRACGLITGQGSSPNATVKSGSHAWFLNQVSPSCAVVPTGHRRQTKCPPPSSAVPRPIMMIPGDIDRHDHFLTFSLALIRPCFACRTSRA